MAGRPMSTTFVARERETAALADALGRAADGTPSVVLLGADAGVGKSRLLAHLTDLAVAQGATAVTGHCVDLGEVGLPYLPFADALGQLAALDGARDAVLEVARTRPSLGRLLPGAAGERTDDLDEAGRRLQLFDGVATAFAAAGRPGAPLLLVLEDLHWADPSSRDVLRYLVARMRDEHLLVVASYRTDDLHRTHPLRPLLGELWRHPRVERLDLEPFTEAELDRFAAAVAGRRLPAADLRRVLERTGGNAYFAEELLEAGSTDALPWSLAEVLRARVERLAPEVQHLARLASVAGRTTYESLLRAVHAREGGGADFDAVVHEAVAAHVLEREDDRLAFRHALLAEAVYGDLLPGEQVRLHRVYRDVLHADVSLASNARLAFHALRCLDLPTALAASIRAASDARKVLAPAEHLRHLETALRLWDSVPDAPEVAGVDRTTVLRRAALAASHVGDLDRAYTLAREGVESAGDDVVQRVRLRVLLVRLMLALETDEESTAPLDEAREALEELPPDAPAAERAWALAMHARTCLVLDRDGEARESAQAAVRVAEEAGDAGAAAGADALATLAVIAVDDTDEAAALLREAADRARAADDLGTELRCTYNLATTHYYAGRLAEARATLDAWQERAQATGMEYSEFGGSRHYFDVLVRYVQGDLRRPEPFVGPAPRLLAETVDAVSMYAAVARGDDDVLDRAQAMRPLWTEDTQIALLSGGPAIDALTWLGRHDDAVRLADELIEHVVSRWDDYFLGGIWLAALGIAALADGAAHDRLTGVDPRLRVRHGDELLERAVRTAERGRPRGGRLGPEGRAWLARAHAEHSRLTGTHDVGLWQATTEAFGYGYVYEEARSRWRWAEALVEAGRREEAAAQLLAAEQVAREIGARPLLGAVQDLARRARLGTARAPSADLLTSRESEVLALVAEGLSNRQIGERLFISGKTVSVHVSNLLAKLGAATRAEAVTLAHRRGLLEVPATRADA